MCCLFTTLVFFGPRLGFLVWWLLQPLRVQSTFNTWIWPLLGLIFVPWATLMYMVVYPGGIIGFDWVWLGLAVVADIVSYGRGAYNRKKVPGYTGP